MEIYNYSDDYYKNFNKGTNPRKPFNPPKILGEPKIKEVFRNVVKPTLNSPLTKTAGGVLAAGSGGYLLGTLLDKGTEAITGKSISDRITDLIIPDDGKYDPNRPANNLFTQARENQVERAMAEGVTPYMTTEQKTISDFNQAMSPLGAPPNKSDLGFSQEFFDQIKSENALNRVKDVSSFMETPNEATAYDASGTPIPNLNQEELEYLKQKNEQKLIAETGFGQPIFSGDRTEETPFPMGGGTFGNDAARNQVTTAMQRQMAPPPAEQPPVGETPVGSEIAPTQTLAAQGSTSQAPVTQGATATQQATPTQQPLSPVNQLIASYLEQNRQRGNRPQEKTPSKLDMYMGDMGMSDVQQLSMNDYRNIAKGMLPEGTGKRVRSAYAKKLKRDDQLGRFDKNYARAIEQKKMQLDQAYRDKQITKQDRDYELNLMKFAAGEARAKEAAEQKAAQMTKEEILSGGNETMSIMKNFMNNPNADNVLSDEMVDRLINFDSTFKVGDTNPLATLGMPEIALYDALYGSRQVVPFFKEGQLPASALEKAKEQGFEYVYREEDGDFKPYYVEPALEAHYKRMEKEAEEAEAKRKEEEQKVVQLGGPFGGTRL